MGGSTITGKCHCGRISFAAAGDPLWVAHCHCNSCRRSTGAPVTTFIGFNRQQVSFTGDRKIYNSSPDVYRGFCENCGTPLSYESDRSPGEIHFYISVIDTPQAFIPNRHVFYDEHIPWLEINDDLPRFDGLDRNHPGSWGPKRG